MDKKLEVKNLQISFRTQGGILRAVRNISFDLYKGETLAIVGESGSGKSVTSKAIMGILSGNSIVDGGEILYDGQDLLKIDEEDFHKIRGDKIAMIFQDPMSSLNPIMRVGQQLTEAMILKAKTGKKNARDAFNNLLERLRTTTIEAITKKEGIENSPSIIEEVTKKTTTFDLFCIENTKIEVIYNEAYTNVIQLEVDIENVLALAKKGVKIEIINELKNVLELFTKSIHPYVISSSDETKKMSGDLSLLVEEKNENCFKVAKPILERILALVKEAIAKTKPNFFTLAYYKMINPEENVENIEIDELNKKTRQFLDENFMFDFIKTAEQGVKYAHDKSIAAKKQAMPILKVALNYFESKEIIEEKAIEYVKTTSAAVKKAINYLEVKKKSIEYVYSSALDNAVKSYFDGIKRNEIEEKVYLKNKAKYDALIAKGKTPDWTLKPQVIVDLDLKIDNIVKIIKNLIQSYQYDIDNSENYDTNEKVIEIIDFLKEQASRLVVKMNKKIARAKAIKLMEEVGIPDPKIRFNQYPFEFSGGMRQRIVIAIALSANPDILICDEPTTALDVTIQAQILELINQIKKQRNLSVIFITHNLGVVANMADRIAVMYAGKIVEKGTSEEIFYEPAHPYTWALLSSMPDLDTKEKLESIPGTPPNMIYPPKGDAFAARNKYALEIDFELEPPLFEITPTHCAATWLLHPNAPKVELPKIIQERIARARKKSE